MCGVCVFAAQISLTMQNEICKENTPDEDFCDFWKAQYGRKLKLPIMTFGGGSIILWDSAGEMPVTVGWA